MRSRRPALPLVLLLLATPSLALAQTEGEADEADSAPASEGDAEEEAGEQPQVPDIRTQTPTIEQVRPATGERTFGDYAAGTGTGTATPPPVDAPWRQITEAELTQPAQSFPWVEWHGYYRFRADGFWNLDLDTNGTSPILPPIEALIPATGGPRDGAYASIPATIGTGAAEKSTSRYYDKGADFLGNANMRLRLRPIFHVTESTRIHLEMNILDNIILGSTADGYDETGRNNTFRADVPLVGFSGTQEPPNLFNAGRDSVSVTQAYGEVQTLIGTIRLGRMASAWGLGVLANGGGSWSGVQEQPRVSFNGLSMAGHTCLDCDSGDYVDRAMFVTKAKGIYIALGWDYPYSGPYAYDSRDYFGQGWDLGDADDVHSYVVSVFSRPLQEQEIAERNRNLLELRKPQFDWGAYFVYREQGVSAENFSPLDTRAPNWVVRGAEAYIFDVWTRFLYVPALRQRLRLEFEGVGILGSIDNIDPRAVNLNSKDIQQFGGALEFEYVNFDLAAGLNTGFATGRSVTEDSTAGFGVRDLVPATGDSKLTAFKFDRNYFVDMIMFREIIGGITNAIYVAPFVQYDFFTKQDDKLGVRLDLILGNAMEADATPSGEGFYGFETDLSLYYREPRYGADIGFGAFFPGAAFDGKQGRARLGNSVDALFPADQTFPNDIGASSAYTLQGRFFWAF